MIHLILLMLPAINHLSSEIVKIKKINCFLNLFELKVIF
jgi:hypothetical protein